MKKIPEGFVAYSAKERERYHTPHASFNKVGVGLNKAVMQSLGNKYCRVIVYYNEETEEVGFWFWKKRTPKSYKLNTNSCNSGWHINCAKGFYQLHQILKKTEKVGTKYFPIHPHEDNEEFWIVNLNKPAKDSD